MKSEMDFTRGPILGPLLRFTLPMLLALCLQAMYGAVDLWVVGWFGSAADVSAVSIGSQLMQTITSVVTGLAMGATILLGQHLGEGRRQEAGEVVGSLNLLSHKAAYDHVTQPMLELIAAMCAPVFLAEKQTALRAVATLDTSALDSV